MKNLLSTLLIVLTINLTYAQLNIVELGFKPYTNELSDIWGYSDSDLNEYALIGAFDGFSVVNVTDPSNLVEVFFEPGVSSIWRDIKTWGTHAYVSTEGGDGILIVDLSPLPGPVTNVSYYTGSQNSFTTVHNLYIDETGKLYIFGANNGQGGAIICDLNNDPMNPIELGIFNDYYFHDGMARGDTLWGAAIYNGFFSAVDVSDPSNPYAIATKNTPGFFTHNAWISDDGNYLFTTDEVEGGYIGSYDVSNLDNIIEVDKVQSSPGENVIPHNVHVLNDFIVTSYYTDGITIHDAARPGNLIEVGNYDTSPNFSGGGFHGSWGTYPFLPSGNILASDIEEGLYVLGPDYIRACYLEGFVTDSITGNSINNVVVKIKGTTYQESTSFDGSYAFGTPTSGVYDIEFSHPSYNSKTLEGISLDNGVLTELEVELNGWFTSIGEEEENAQMKAGPNPFITSMNLKYNIENTLQPNAFIEVRSISGVLVKKILIYENQSNIQIGEELAKGVYTIRIVNGSTIIKPISVIKL